jgi:hypothetical protein
MATAVGIEGKTGELTPRQRARWQAEDILPRSRRKNLGRGKGTASIPPPEAETAARIQAARRLWPKALDFGHLRVLLWFEGFDVPLERLRQDLLTILRGTETAHAAARAADEGAAWEAAERLAVKGIQQMGGEAAQRFRRALPDPDAFREVLTAMFAMAMGETVGFRDAAPFLQDDPLDEPVKEPSLGELTEELLQLSEARALGHGAAPPEAWLSGTPGGEFEEIQDRGWADLLGGIEAVAAGSAEQLLTARRDVAALRDLGQLVYLFPPEQRPLGFGALALLHDATAIELAMLHCMYVRVRREPGTEATITQLTEGIEAAVERGRMALADALAAQLSEQGAASR